LADEELLEVGNPNPDPTEHPKVWDLTAKSAPAERLGMASEKPAAFEKILRPVV
jgi:hypothetical protein